MSSTSTTPFSGHAADHMALFNERQPIPKTVIHPVSAGILGPEKLEARQVRDAMLREVECDLVTTLPVAVSLRNWLDEKIVELSQGISADQIG